MKIIFAGTPDFSVPTLQALLDSPHEVVAVYTQPDRPKGRGRQLAVSPVKALALSHHRPVEQPASLKSAEAQAILKSYEADLMVVVAFGMLLPKAVLAMPKYGCINVHASLLPRWRGASPIQQAILAGDKKTGVTIMQMEAGLDSGAMLLKKSDDIMPNDTAQTLHDRLSLMGAEALLTVISQIENNQLMPQKQDESLVTYAPKIKKDDAKIDWNKPAVVIERQVRAFNPWPVAFCDWNNSVMRIWQAKALNEKTQQSPGCVERHDKKAIYVATGEGVLAIETLQIPGGKPIRAEDYINAHYT